MLILRHHSRRCVDHRRARSRGHASALELSRMDANTRLRHQSPAASAPLANDSTTGVRSDRRCPFTAATCSGGASAAGGGLSDELRARSATRRSLALWCLALTATVAACGQSAPRPSAPPQAPIESDLPIGLRLALLEGHLKVGRALVDAGEPTQALPHFGHPVRELYGGLRPMIAARRGEQFQGALETLEGLAVLEPGSARFDAAFDVALRKVQEGNLLVSDEIRRSDAYTLGLLAGIATVAAQEYRAALVAGRVGSLVEYHDAHGFMLQAQAIIGQSTSSNPDIHTAAETVAHMQGMVSTLAPPVSPAADTLFEAEAARLRALTALNENG